MVRTLFIPPARTRRPLSEAAVGDRLQRGLVRLILDVLASVRCAPSRGRSQGPTEDPNRPWDFPDVPQVDSISGGSES